MLIVKYLFCSFCSEGFAFPLSETLDRHIIYCATPSAFLFNTADADESRLYLKINLFLHNNLWDPPPPLKKPNNKHHSCFILEMG